VHCPSSVLLRPRHCCYGGMAVRRTLACWLLGLCLLAAAAIPPRVERVAPASAARSMPAAAGSGSLVRAANPPQLLLPPLPPYRPAGLWPAPAVPPGSLTLGGANDLTFDYADVLAWDSAHGARWATVSHHRIALDRCGQPNWAGGVAAATTRQGAG